MPAAGLRGWWWGMRTYSPVAADYLGTGARNLGGVPNLRTANIELPRLGVNDGVFGPLRAYGEEVVPARGHVLPDSWRV